MSRENPINPDGTQPASEVIPEAATLEVQAASEQLKGKVLNYFPSANKLSSDYMDAVSRIDANIAYYHDKDITNMNLVADDARVQALVGRHQEALLRVCAAAFGRPLVDNDYDRDQQMIDIAKSSPLYFALHELGNLPEYNQASTERATEIALGLLHLLVFRKGDNKADLQAISVADIEQACRFIHLLFAAKPLRPALGKLQNVAELDRMLVQEAWGVSYNDVVELYLEWQDDLGQSVDLLLKARAEEQTRLVLEAAQKRRAHLETIGLQHLYNNVQFDAQPTDFTRGYENLIEDSESVEFLSRFIKDRSMISLGCGPIPEREIALVKQAGAKDYKGVDLFQVGEASSSIQIGNNTISGLPVEGVRQDMLQYVFSQEENFANVILNGIDRSIIKTKDGKENNEYTQVLIESIARVVPPGGVAMGYDSPFLSGLRQFGFKKISLPRESSGFDDLEIWQKPG